MSGKNEGQAVKRVVDPDKVKILRPVKFLGVGFQIFVKDLDGSTKTLNDIEETNLVREIKEKVEEKTRVPVNQQRLIFWGKQLEDNRSVKDYNIEKESTLHLVLSLKGGRLPVDVLGAGFDIIGNLEDLKRLIIFMHREGNRIYGKTLGAIQGDFLYSIADRSRELVTKNRTLDDLIANDTNSDIDQEDWKNVIGIIANLQPELLYNDPADATATLSGAKLDYFIDVKDKTLVILDEAVAGNHDEEIKKIFGDANLAVAKQKYQNAAIALRALWKKFDTDLNGDDAEIYLGGYAICGHTVHLANSFFDGENGAIVTLLHEAAHLGNADVLDKGYNKSPLYEGLPEAVKLTNADHFAELAQRILGTSAYAGTDKDVFTPVNLGGGGGGGATIYQLGNRRASEQFRIAWTAGLRLLKRFREVYALGEIDHLSKTPHKYVNLREDKLFEWLYAWATQIGLPMKDRVHANKIEVTKLDITLVEALARKLMRYNLRCPGLSAKDDKDPGITVLSADGLTELNIDRSIEREGPFTGNLGRERILVDYMVRNSDRVLNPI